MSDRPLIKLLMSMGEGTFAQSALAFVNERLPADHVSLFVLDDELIPHLLDAASRKGDLTAKVAGRLYERSEFYRHDPNTRAVDIGTGEEDVMVFRQRAMDIKDRSYRERLYQRFNLLERLSAIRCVGGQWFVVSVYRGVTSKSFTAMDTRTFLEMAALLVTCTAKHAGLTKRSPPKRPKLGSQAHGYLESLLGAIESRLTLRERQVCALALSGYGSDGIASILTISTSTVATLRRRAYGKLGINKVNELFALCIARIPRGAITD